MMNFPEVSTVSIRERLRSETRTEHDAIERVSGLMHPELSSADYQHCLTKFYGFYRPVEQMLAACLADPCQDSLMDGRHKAALLRRDLQYLGVIDPDAVPVCTLLPTVKTVAAGFGCLYVLEGATLGGQIISAHVASRFGYDAQHGAAFFHGYGSQTGARWRTFGQALTAFAADASTDDDIVDAATATFRTLRLWYESEGSA
jgi:heme oxygenase